MHVAQPLKHRQYFLAVDAERLVQLASRLEHLGDQSLSDRHRTHVAQPFEYREFFLPADAERLVELTPHVQHVGNQVPCERAIAQIVRRDHGQHFPGQAQAVVEFPQSPMVPGQLHSPANGRRIRTAVARVWRRRQPLAQLGHPLPALRFQQPPDLRCRAHGERIDHAAERGEKQERSAPPIQKIGRLLRHRLQQVLGQPDDHGSRYVLPPLFPAVVERPQPGVVRSGRADARCQPGYHDGRPRRFVCQRPLDERQHVAAPGGNGYPHGRRREQLIEPVEEPVPQRRFIADRHQQREAVGAPECPAEGLQRRLGGFRFVANRNRRGGRIRHRDTAPGFGRRG